MSSKGCTRPCPDVDRSPRFALRRCNALHAALQALEVALVELVLVGGAVPFDLGEAARVRARARPLHVGVGPHLDGWSRAAAPSDAERRRGEPCASAPVCRSTRIRQRPLHRSSVADSCVIPRSFQDAVRTPVGGPSARTSARCPPERDSRERPPRAIRRPRRSSLIEPVDFDCGARRNGSSKEGEGRRPDRQQGVRAIEPLR